MQHFVPKTHISSAVKQLRVWITLAACVVAICCASQMVVYGFAAYTDVRWTEAKPAKKADRPLRVVAAQPSESSGVPIGGEGQTSENGGDGTVVGGVRGAAVDSAVVPFDPSRVKSATDRVLQRISGLACGIGVISTVVLCVLTLLGVVIAGGGSIPGVERATTAGVWSLVLAMLSLPWADLMPSMGLPGLFASYEHMSALLDHTGPTITSLSGAGLAGQWVVAPMVAMFVSLGVCLWFRAGVERGVIINSPSELDRAVEREVEQISRRGVTSSAPKAVGALNRAIGDEPVVAPASPVEHAIEQAAAMAGVGGGETLTKRRMPRGVVDSDYKRPI